MLANGASVAKEWNLRPRIALSADQVAQLASDIIWLVSETVSLPDGTTETVLAPQVYLAHAGADNVKPNSALVTGDGVSVVTTDGIVDQSA